MPSTILISDDEPAVVDVTSRFLTKAGYHVRDVPGGYAHETIARCRSAPPALLITDIKKPGMNGLAMCRALRRDLRTRHIPIVVVSGYPQLGGENAIMAGADAFVPKPYSVAQLLRVVRDLFATREIGLRLHPQTCLPPWPVLEEQLRRFAAHHDWALLQIWLEPLASLELFAWTVGQMVDRHADLWLAHDAIETRLLIAGTPASVDQIHGELQASFSAAPRDPRAPRLHLVRAQGQRLYLRELAGLFGAPSQRLQFADIDDESAVLGG
jgi:CheY-like chemotaxis protein